MEMGLSYFGWLCQCVQRWTSRMKVYTLHTTVRGGSGRGSIIEKRKQPPYLFIFIGECKSGKSTAIANIFKANKLPANTKSEDNDSESSESEQHESQDIFSHWTHKSNDDVLEVVEVPGLLRNDSLEQDATIITALASLLKQNSQCRLPTVVFVSARLDDNRFEGSQSTFSRTLKCLLQVRSLLTDENCSNIVLLLTHGDRPEVSHVKSDLDYRVERYEHAFSSIFDVQSVASMVVTKDSYPFGRLQKSLQKMTNSESHFSLLQKFLQSTTLKSIQTPLINHEFYTYKSIDVNELLPQQSSGGIRKVASYLNQDASMSYLFDGSESEDEISMSGTTKEKFVPVEIGYSNPTEALLNSDEIHNCVRPRCTITLANGDLISVEDALVGDRVLSLHSKVGVITRICRLDLRFKKVADASGILMKPYYPCWYCDSQEFVQICMIYAKRSLSNNAPLNQDGNQCMEFLYNYGQGFFPKTYDASIHQEFADAMQTSAFYIEVDGGSGTLIADGFIRASLIKKMM